MIATVTLNASLDRTYHVPGFAAGGVFQPAGVQVSPGGKGLNVASFCRALGAPVVATGLSGGFTGALIRRLLDERGVRHDFVSIEAESRTCLILADPAGRTLTEVREAGPRIGPGDEDRIAAKVAELAAESRVVVFSGSLPPGARPELYRELAGLARAAGARVLVDASGEPLRLALAAGPDVIKPNLQELEDVLGRLGEPPLPAGAKDDPETLRRAALAAARRLRDRGPGTVVVSLGAAGSVLAGEGRAGAAIPPPIEAVNTVSCGDALVAGLAVGLLQGLSLEEALRLATAAATAKARRLETGVLDPADVGELLAATLWKPMAS